MNKPLLDGILVADFSRILAGPLCTTMLADSGARVIKVEEPERGDETRRWGPPFQRGVSGYYLSVNRNKESLALDLKSAFGREAARRLIEQADVVVDNFLPADREKLGLGSVHSINPRVIHCSISGFESDGPLAGVPGYDLLAQAAAGMMAITGDPDGDPVKVGVAVSDVLTAHYAHGAITTALYAREKTGEGATLEIALFGATVASLVNIAQGYLLTRKEPERHGSAHPSIVPYQAFHASDGMIVVAAATDRQFDALCRKVLQRSDIADSPRYRSNTERVASRRSLVRLLEKELRTRPAAHWVRSCRRHGIPASRVATMREVFRAAKNLVGTLEHPVAGRYQTVGSPVRVDGVRPPLRSAAPELGEGTERILAELGMISAS